MKLSSREKVLAMAVGAAVIIVLNIALLSAFAHKSTLLREQLLQRKQQWDAMQVLLGEEGLWAARDAALTAKQPKLTNENAAGVELLDLIRVLARKDDVTLDNEVFGGVKKSASYRSVPVTLDAHSTWPDLIRFLYALQKPDQFIVCEDANIQLDPSDQSKMLCHFTIARWYAP